MKPHKSHWICFASLAGIVLLWVLGPRPVFSQEEVNTFSTSAPNDAPAVKETVAPDAYEPDNTWQTSRVILLNDQRPHPDLPSYKPIQDHNFHVGC